MTDYLAIARERAKADQAEHERLRVLLDTERKQLAALKASDKPDPMQVAALEGIIEIDAVSVLQSFRRSVEYAEVVAKGRGR